VKRLFALIFALVLCLPLVAWAQDNPDQTNPEDQVMQTTTAPVDLKAQRKAEFNAARGERIRNRCSALKTKIDQLSGRVGTLKDARGKLVSNKVTKLEALIERLNNKDVDTSSLAEDVATLKTMSNELDALWAAYQTAVEKLKDTKCTEQGSAEAFHEALEATKAAMADVRTKYQEIKAFFVSDIKPDLQAIRQALAEDNGS